METTKLCERCHRNPPVLLFKRMFLCNACVDAIWLELAIEKTQCNELGRYSKTLER